MFIFQRLALFIIISINNIDKNNNIRFFIFSIVLHLLKIIGISYLNSTATKKWSPINCFILSINNIDKNNNIRFFIFSIVLHLLKIIGISYLNSTATKKWSPINCFILSGLSYIVFAPERSLLFSNALLIFSKFLSS